MFFTILLFWRIFFENLTYIVIPIFFSSLQVRTDLYIIFEKFPMIPIFLKYLRFPSYSKFRIVFLKRDIFPEKNYITII